MAYEQEVKRADGSISSQHVIAVFELTFNCKLRLRNAPVMMDERWSFVVRAVSCQF